MNDELNDEQLIFWHEYLDSIGASEDDFYVEASIAGNSEIADELLQLYLDGKKSAGSGLVKDYELAGDDLPKVGNHWVILDSEENPRCIVKTIAVEFHQFADVPEKVAIAEGEGDLSIAYWKQAHRKFFTPYLADLQIEDLEQAQVVTEFYQVVYK